MLNEINDIAEIYGSKLKIIWPGKASIWQKSGPSEERSNGTFGNTYPMKLGIPLFKKALTIPPCYFSAFVLALISLDYGGPLTIGTSRKF